MAGPSDALGSLWSPLGNTPTIRTKAMKKFESFARRSMVSFQANDKKPELGHRTHDEDVNKLRL
jgi:hypothetical protein